MSARTHQNQDLFESGPCCLVVRLMQHQRLGDAASCDMQKPRGTEYQRLGDLLPQDVFSEVPTVSEMRSHMKEWARCAREPRRRIKDLERLVILKNGEVSLTGTCGWHDHCPVKYMGRAKVGTPGAVWESTSAAHSDLVAVLRKDALLNSPVRRDTHAAVAERLADDSASPRAIDVQRDLSAIVEQGASLEFIGRQKRRLSKTAAVDPWADERFKVDCDYPHLMPK